MRFNNLLYKLTSLNTHTSNLSSLILQPHGNDVIRHQAGQYILLKNAPYESSAFTIANAPREDHSIELLIRHSPNDPTTQSLINRLRATKIAELEGPFGDCVYQKHSSLPIILLAGGTGFAQSKALLEQAVKEKDPRPVHLYWGINSAQECYRPELLLQWLTDLAHFKYTLVLGKMNRVYEVITQDYPDLSLLQMYASGSWSLIDDSWAHFLNFGLKRDLIYSDRFAF